MSWPLTISRQILSKNQLLLLCRAARFICPQPQKLQPWRQPEHCGDWVACEGTVQSNRIAWFNGKVGRVGREYGGRAGKRRHYGGSAGRHIAPIWQDALEVVEDEVDRVLEKNCELARTVDRVRRENDAGQVLMEKKSRGKRGNVGLGQVKVLQRGKRVDDRVTKTLERACSS